VVDDGLQHQPSQQVAVLRNRTQKL
jgi:hypothetical protein